MRDCGAARFMSHKLLRAVSTVQKARVRNPSDVFDESRILMSACRRLGQSESSCDLLNEGYFLLWACSCQDGFAAKAFLLICHRRFSCKSCQLY